MFNPPTTKLFRSITLTAKRVCATPWICDFPIDFYVCEIVHGYVNGVKESNGDS